MASESKQSSKRTGKKLICCADVEEINIDTCSKSNSKRAEVTGIEFRKPTEKKSEGTKLICCADVEEITDDTCSKSNSKRAGIEFRKPTEKKSEGKLVTGYPKKFQSTIALEGETGTQEAVNNTCSRNSLKRAEVTDLEFRKPVKKNISEGNSSEVNKKNSAKTASSVQKPVSAETASSFSGRTKGFDQTFENMNHLKKLPRVYELVMQSERPVLVCCNFKSDVDDLWMYLKQQRTKVSKLHGSVEQSARGEALQDFKHRKMDVLVSTAKLITGIQFPFHLNVINFDLPQDYCDYKRTLVKAKRTITFINEDSPRNSMLELSADEEIQVPRFITDINDRCRSGIIRCRKPEKEVWNM